MSASIVSFVVVVVEFIHKTMLAQTRLVLEYLRTTADIEMQKDS